MTNDPTRQLMADYREVFSTSAGQRVLADIMRLAGLFEAVEVSDPIELAKIVGRQNLIKEIMTLHGVGLDVYINTLRKGEENDRREYGDDYGTGRTGGGGWI